VWQYVIVEVSKLQKDKFISLDLDAVEAWLLQFVPQIVRGDEFSEEDIREFMCKSDRLSLVLGFRDGKSDILGFCYTCKSKRVPWVVGIGIKRSMHGNGLGKKLLRYVMDYYKQHTVVKAMIRERNDASFGLFESVCKDVKRRHDEQQIHPDDGHHDLGFLVEVNLRLM
jgi:RimJ/RimL family protein N-acetyltransferase